MRSATCGTRQGFTATCVPQALITTTSASLHCDTDRRSPSLVTVDDRMGSHPHPCCMLAISYSWSQGVIHA